MKASVAAFALIALCTIAGVVSAEEGSDVIVLTAQNFDAVVKENADSGVFLEFYAPWCGHCKNLAPIYEEVATELVGRAVVGKIDATEHSSLGQRFNVRGYPTVLFVKGNNYYSYDKSRTKEALVEFATGGFADAEATPLPPAAEAADEGPSAVVVVTDKTIGATLAKSSDKGVLLEFYAPWCGHCKNLAPVYEKLAKKVAGDFVVAKVDATEERASAGRFGVKGFPTVVFAKGGTAYKFGGSRTVDAFVEFMNGGYEKADESFEIEAAEEDEGEFDINAPSDVLVLDDSNFEDDTQAGTGATTGDWLVMFYAPWCGHCKKLHPTLSKVATELKGEVNVAHLDATANPTLGRRFTIKGYPTLKMFSHGKEYNYEGKRTKAAIVAWAKGGFKESEGTDVLPPLSATEDLVKMLSNEWESLSRDLKTLYRHKLGALIVIFSGGATAGVLIAFAMFAALGGLKPEVVYVDQLPAGVAASSGSGAGSGAAAPAQDADKPKKE